MRANMAAADTAAQVTGQSDNSSTPLPGFTPEQWQTLVTVFGNLQPSSDRLTGELNNKLWIIDTGCSNHITNDISILTHVKDVKACSVGLPNGQTVLATKEGVVKLCENLSLTHVLYVPQLNCNLISVSQLVDELSCFVQITNDMCAIQDQHSRELIGVGERQDGLYYFRQMPMVKANTVSGSTSSMELWHKRMGHPSVKIVKLLPSVSSSSSENENRLNKACEICFRAKQSRDKFPLSTNKATRIFEMVHCDLWGPYNTISSCGARYFLTIVDDYSRAVWVYLLIDKKEVFKMFMSFIALVDRQFDKKIRFVRSDNGTEFNSLKDYFVANGILFQSSCVGTPQQNGRVERKHRHILNVARALRFQGNLPLYFWGECVLIAGHLINRTPSAVLNNKCPYEILFGTLPDYDELRVFGSLCFAHNQSSKDDKFASLVENAYLWDILLERKVGICLILKQRNFLFREM